MKFFLLIALNLLFCGFAYADGVCVATQSGYEAFCDVQPSEAPCNFHDQCIWANAGREACSASEIGYEAFCGVQPSEASCNFHDQCFWTN